MVLIAGSSYIRDSDFGADQPVCAHALVATLYIITLSWSSWSRLPFHTISLPSRVNVGSMPWSKPPPVRVTGSKAPHVNATGWAPAVPGLSTRSISRRRRIVWPPTLTVRSASES